MIAFLFVCKCVPRIGSVDLARLSFFTAVPFTAVPFTVVPFIAVPFLKIAVSFCFLACVY